MSFKKYTSYIYTGKMLAVFMIICISILSACSSGKQSNMPASSQEAKAAATQGEASGSLPKTREITDMAGRKVIIPSEVNKVYSSSAIGTVTMYTLAPEKLAGWNFALVPGEKKYIDKKYHDIPALGAWSGKKGAANVEEIIRLKPDFILSMGNVDDTQVSAANAIQDQTGIPVVMLDGPLTGMDKAYELLGEYIGEQERAKELGSYCKQAIAETKAMIDKIPEDKMRRVYYAEGPKGLQTDPSGSFHTEVLDFVRGINVADILAQKGTGMSNVSMEQVLSWNPDIILVSVDKEGDLSQGGFYSEVFNDPSWAQIKAVKDKKIYEVPAYPFNWFDRPPSVSRVLGVKWLAGLIYPEYVPLDIEKEVKEFYSLFYNKSLSDSEVSELLQRARAK
ncbi:iron complex transport system substrate-binding protein [Anaerobacterium chartisolvens]|uniref:Iron complex transport system substrate-binding protein n=1 Tax=Anaerobacterium chartisolvens TaxID=1297424 RepID=A0A369BN23_9FIRM|nr:ABC transporter substrate-binding protein [Anaerobacterium chartisolvens]RCX21074.1 iron complex transport system substrate-binding protein [Anaerobacterium chartisolvens]